MVSADKVVKETKRNLKRYEGEINNADRLVKLLERSGVPVAEEKVMVSEMKDQRDKIRYALKKDAEEQEAQ